MGTAFGYILSENDRMELRTKLKEPEPHCYFCGSKYVSIIKGNNGPRKVKCLICERTFSVWHGYNYIL